MSVHITLAEAKAQCRVDFIDDDTYIQSLCDLVEELVLTEVQGTITGEGTVTTNGTVNLVGLDTYFTDYTVGDTIKLTDETLRTIATITSDTALTVTVAFTTTDTGIAFVVHPGLPSPLPLGLKQAMLLLVGHYYLIREPVVVGVSLNEVPFAYKYLVAPYKNWTFV